MKTGYWRILLLVTGGMLVAGVLPCRAVEPKPQAQEEEIGWIEDEPMPEGVRPPTAEHKAAVVRACVERNWRYCARLHIELFGNTRGT